VLDGLKWQVLGYGLMGTLGLGSGAIAQTPAEPTIPDAVPIDAVEVDPLMQQLPPVDALSDLQPDHWAYKYVKSLNERYNLITGDTAGKFRGNEPLTRDEFAVVLAQVLARVEVFREQEREELNALRRLVESYREALGSLKTRMGGLEERSAKVAAQQFSPTTKLQTNIVQTMSDGTGANNVGLSRVRLNLTSSFGGADQLVTQLEFGNGATDAIAQAQAAQGGKLSGITGIADGGGLIEVGAPVRGQLRELYYQFPVGETVTIAAGSNLPPSDFVDYNRFANSSGQNFASSFLANNPLIVQNDLDRQGGAGVAATWQISKKAAVRGLYVAGNAGNSGVGLFRDRYQGTLEAEYQPTPQTAVRLQYTNAKVNGTAINAVGLNAEWQVARELALFGRYGIGSYEGFNTRLAQNLDLTPQSWAAGLTVRNFLVTGSKVGLAIGQPFIASGFGNATQTNVETYFSFMLNDRINLIPSLQLVMNPDNQRTRSVWQWAFRAVVDF
jgi:BMFP domain-containing protein YqiC